MGGGKAPNVNYSPLWEGGAPCFYFFIFHFAGREPPVVLSSQHLLLKLFFTFLIILFLGPCFLLLGHPPEFSWLYNEF